MLKTVPCRIERTINYEINDEVLLDLLKGAGLWIPDSTNIEIFVNVPGKVCKNNPINVTIEEELRDYRVKS
jgi:hypothetical protein